VKTDIKLFDKELAYYLYDNEQALALCNIRASAFKKYYELLSLLDK